MLPLSWSSSDEIDWVIEETRRRTDRPFGVNLGLAWEQRERLASALGAGVRVVSFFWGDAGALIGERGRGSLERRDRARPCASLEAPAAPTEERKLVTGVFVDVVGSTARSEQLDPEDVRSMLFRRELMLFGGTVEKFIGDAVFALFGAPVQHEDDPERAVRAALAARESIARLNEQNQWLDLHIRIGIGQLSYEASQHAIEYHDAEPVQAKGKAEPIVVWEAAGVRDSPAPARPRLPLYGRTAETLALVAVWDGVVASSGPSQAGRTRRTFCRAISPASFGVVVLDEVPSPTAVDFLRRADEAMYEAKRTRHALTIVA